MRNESVKKLHKRAFFLWAFPGLPIAVGCVLTNNVTLILVWNLVISIYTVMMEHALGWRQEDKDGN